jgi:uncharacterized protein (UPF0332 family)
VTVPDELLPLLVKARRYLRSAEMLRRDGDYDSAASRLYYAMFYCAEALLWSRGQSYSKHSAVIAAFGRELVKTGLLPAELHQWLNEGFKTRQIGDYEVGTAITEPLVLDLQQKARRLLDATEAFLRQP